MILNKIAKFFGYIGLNILYSTMLLSVSVVIALCISMIVLLILELLGESITFPMYKLVVGNTIPIWIFFELIVARKVRKILKERK